MRIVTDSTVDLPQELLDKYKIKIVPLKIQLGSETFVDHYGIKPVEYYRRLRASEFFPTTTQPSPQDFIDAYKEAASDDDFVLSVHISSKLSGTYQSARLARQSFCDKKIFIIDSGQASVGLGMMVLGLAKAAAEGVSESAAQNMASRLIAETKTFFSIDSLEYLKRGGRIGAAQVFLGDILKVKPLLSVKDGTIQPLEKLRGRKNVVQRLSQIVSDAAARKGRLKIGLIYADNEDYLSMLKDELVKINNIEIEFVSRIGAVIASHAGPDAIGVSFYPADLS